MNIAIWWGRNDTYDKRGYNLIKGGGNEKIFGSWVGFFPNPKSFPHRFGGMERVHTWWGQQLLEIPFFQYVVCDLGRDEGIQFYAGSESNRREKFKCSMACKGSSLSQLRPLVGHHDLAIKKTMRKVLGLLYCKDFEKATS